MGHRNIKERTKIHYRPILEDRIGPTLGKLAEAVSVTELRRKGIGKGDASLNGSYLQFVSLLSGAWRFALGVPP